MLSSSILFAMRCSRLGCLPNLSNFPLEPFAQRIFNFLHGPCLVKRVKGFSRFIKRNMPARYDLVLLFLGLHRLLRLGKYK